MVLDSDPRRGQPGGRPLALVGGIVAASAVAGAVGLATGSIDLGTTIKNRLPFGSPVFAGMALTGIVGMPMAVAAVQGWRETRRSSALTTMAGGLLMGWIVVELAVIRVFSPLQPICFPAGAGVAFPGLRHWHRTGYLRWKDDDRE
ncbi:MAG TPA: hypothetical protein VNC61_02435 [Acidimicrobiales bacterium]|nr:hypothetical protein [Acidimicrobiales bacterium]